ncbi:hypothetical protein MNBD_BACTEROID03-1068 [hydrothermal vent metagenome]|uniref:ISXO2-like transposase domain-containing protein n=1 Tax=hydrothermal vent metagenome TaxID=652676 RepID=A0A3B0TWT7_9ZZZZ
MQKLFFFDNTSCKITYYKSNSSSFGMITIHQVKSWVRSTFSWVHQDHIENYLDEYSYRLNRSIHKQTIFDNLINRMKNTQHIGYQKIKTRS